MSPKKVIEQVTLRLDSEVLDRAERLTEFLTSEAGATADRAKVLRAAVMLGLKELEKRKAKAETHE